MSAVALLLGGLGVANTVAIAEIERRWEVGVRRAPGATRAHIRRQFLGEPVLLAGVHPAARAAQMPSTAASSSA